MPHLRARTTQNAVLLRLRSQAIGNATRFFESRDFIQVHPPVITSSDSEGAGQVFTVSADTSQHPANQEVQEVEKAGQDEHPTKHGAEEGEHESPDEHPAKHEAEEMDKERHEEHVRRTHFFKTPKYLTVSSQLHLEALAAAVTKVWALAPAFRAERSDTSRHLSEFYMLEAEMGFTDSLEDVMKLLEDLMKRLVQRMTGSRESKELLRSLRMEHEHLELQSQETGRTNVEEDSSRITSPQLQTRWKGILEENWPRITYTEAIQHLQDAVNGGNIVFEHAPRWGSGLQAEHERFIATVVGDGRPVFVTDFPRDIKPFYMAPSSASSSTKDEDESQGKESPPGPTVACFDLLVPDLGELAGGSLREHREAKLIQSMQQHGLLKLTESSSTSTDPSNQDQTMTSVDGTPNPLQWYIDLRKWGSVPHGGFGVGFDRLLAYLAGVRNVRDVVTFPRHFQQCRC